MSKPSYPSAIKMVSSALKEICFQSGLIGACLVCFVGPAYFHVLESMKFLGDDWSSDRCTFAILASVLHTLAYCVINGSFALFDYLEMFQKYKLHRRPYMIPKAKLYFGMLGMNAPLPSFEHTFRTFCVAHLFNGIGFYFTHRLLHTPQLYFLHKQHHEYTGSIGISAEYANPVETILSNIGPTLGGVIIMGTHPLCVLVWLGVRLQQTFETHSGYCFAGTWLDKLGLCHASGAAHHDFHHSVNTGNFGGGEYMDWLFGTMDTYVAGGGAEGYIAKKNKSVSD